MANKKNKYSILAVLLTLVMAVVGCDNGGSGSDEDVDVSLNGTWELIECTDDEGEDCFLQESNMKFNDGNLEASAMGILFIKGTYSTNGNKITLIATHLHGSYLNTAYEDFFESEGVFGIPKMFESKFSTKSELKTQMRTKSEEIATILIAIYAEEYPEEYAALNAEEKIQMKAKTKSNFEKGIDKEIDDMFEAFEPTTETYSITGDNLTLTDEDGGTETYIKK